MHSDEHRRQRPPLSPQEGWLSDGRLVLHFNPVRYSQYFQVLELTTGELIPGQAPLLKRRNGAGGHGQPFCWGQQPKRPREPGPTNRLRLVL